MSRTLNISEEERAVALAKQDRRYFAALYESTFDRVYRFVYRRVGNKDAAGDITSQTYLKAMLHLPKYEHRGVPFVSWLYRIALNETNQFFRKNKKLMEVEIPVNFLADIANELESNDSSNMDQLIAILNGLEFEQMSLIEMRFFEKMSFAEIASVVGGSEESVKMKVYRLIKKMRKGLEGGDHESF